MKKTVRKDSFCEKFSTRLSVVRLYAFGSTFTFKVDLNQFLKEQKTTSAGNRNGHARVTASGGTCGLAGLFVPCCSEVCKSYSDPAATFVFPTQIRRDNISSEGGGSPLLCTVPSTAPAAEEALRAATLRCVALAVLSVALWNRPPRPAEGGPAG